VFHGALELDSDQVNSFIWKYRLANLDRVISGTEIVGRDLVKKDGSLRRFIGCRVQLLNKHEQTIVSEGVISRPFGTSGKFRVELRTAVQENIKFSDFIIQLAYKNEFKL
jgi:putative transposon-encoded protein